MNLVMIHPFRDGNGRMARCLQTLILSREGITYPEFSSIEEYLGRNTQAYYAVLATLGQGAWNPGNDSRPWIRFILAAHLRQERALIRRIRESEMLWDRLEKLVSAAGIDERAVAVVWDAAIGFRVRRTTYVAACKSMGEELSEHMASRDLRQLTDADLLIPKGEKRARFYVASETVRNVQRRIIDARDPREAGDLFDGSA